MMGGMQGHDGGDAAWHREQRERNALEKAAYRKGQEDMMERCALVCDEYADDPVCCSNLIRNMETHDERS